MRHLTFPPGTELAFGPQAERLERVSATLADVFRGWGFQSLQLPTFDVHETFREIAGRHYRLTDPEGRELTLRADFTQAAAKALAPLLAASERQLRAWYHGRVFRFESSGHAARVETTQSGVEWLRADGRVFDAALLALADECLVACGITDAQIVVGHAGFVQSVLGDNGRNDPDLAEALDQKNPSRIREVAKRIGIDDPTLLAKLPVLCGGREVLNDARELGVGDEATQALDELNALADSLESLPLTNGLLFDLGEVRRFDYYSGIMFKVYHSASGSELAGGGRYDSLYQSHGLTVPSVGLAFDDVGLAGVAPQRNRADDTTLIDASSPDALAQLVAQRRDGNSATLEGNA